MRILLLGHVGNYYKFKFESIKYIYQIHYKVLFVCINLFLILKLNEILKRLENDEI